MSPSAATVALLTSRERKADAQASLAALERETSGRWSVVVVEEQEQEGYSLAAAVDHARLGAGTDLFAWVPDEIRVRGDWLSLLRCAFEERAALAVPLHVHADGRLAFSGAVPWLDGRGLLTALTDLPVGRRPTVAAPGALTLIDLSKVPGLVFDRRYQKYFFDVDYALSVWEAGFRVLCCPEALVTTLGSRPVVQDPSRAGRLWLEDRDAFIEKWIRSGRLEALRDRVFVSEPFLDELFRAAARTTEFFARELEDSAPPDLGRRLLALIDEVGVASRPLVEAKLREIDRRPHFAAHRPERRLALGTLNWMERTRARVDVRAPSPPARAKIRPSGPPLVSAICSAYRAERFMRGLLEDLEAQTMARELEIVIVDSASPEQEGEIVREFQRRYSNITYLRTRERENSHVSTNRAIQLARGKYLANACSDDRRRPDALERMVAVMEKNPGVALAYSDLAITEHENETFETARVVAHYFWPDFDRRGLFEACYVGPQPLWRRDLHERYGYFDPTFWAAGDYEFWLRLAVREDFVHVPEVLGLYYLSPASNGNRDPDLTFRESELARARHWPSGWGERPAPGAWFYRAVQEREEVIWQHSAR